MIPDHIYPELDKVLTKAQTKLIMDKVQKNKNEYLEDSSDIENLRQTLLVFDSMEKKVREVSSQKKGKKKRILTEQDLVNKEIDTLQMDR